MGAVGAFVMALVRGRLNFGLLKQALTSTTRLTSFATMILVGSTVFSLVFQGVDGSRWVEHLLIDLPGGTVGFLIFVNLLIFFLAFLPQFADPQLGPVGPQIFVFGAVFILAAFLVFGAIAVFSGAFGNLLLRSPKAQFWLNKITAVVFLGLAVKLATAQR